MIRLYLYTQFTYKFAQTKKSHNFQNYFTESYSSITSVDCCIQFGRADHHLAIL